MVAGVDDGAELVLAGVAVGVLYVADESCPTGSSCQQAAAGGLQEIGDAVSDVASRIHNLFAKEHSKGTRPSTQEKHEKGQARKNRDRGGEKADPGRRPPRKRPPDHKGPWPKKPASEESRSAQPEGAPQGGGEMKGEEPRICVPKPGSSC